MDTEENHTRRPSIFNQQYNAPDSAVITSFVLPTIGFCIAIIIAMLCGIRKIREWELEKIIETRRKRRVVERITKELRGKNLQTLERLRNLKRRNASLNSAPGRSSDTLTEVVVQRNKPPPQYTRKPLFNGLDSPPPDYDEALLQEFLQECEMHRVPSYTDYVFR